MPSPTRPPKICVCIGHPDARHAAELALASCQHGESFLEIRLDLLDDPATGPGIAGRVRRACPAATILATCRRTPNGGRFSGTLAQQTEILREAVGAGADIVDLEIESIEAGTAVLDPFRSICTTLVSFHDFVQTPELDPVLERLAATGADILKVATRVRHPSDNLRLLALCRHHDNVVVTGMGETGSIARLAAVAQGGLFAYTAPVAHADVADPGSAEPRGEPTAPGQVAADTARDLYRVQAASPETRILAVIAKPVAHSLSPLVHNRAFRACGYDGLYVPLLVEPADIADFLRTARDLPLHGVSVTIPHKQDIIPHLDRIDDTALEIGAVNTVYWQRGRLCGTNTDAQGIVKPLGRRVGLRDKHVLVVGNGGAARAALVALKRAGARLTVTGRNSARIQRLASELGVTGATLASLGSKYFDVLVQATSVGMLPHAEDNLFPARIPADVVFDLVYNPLQTALLEHAAAERKLTISGIEMFIEQAAAQFRIWTDLEAPRQIMRKVVLERRVR